ncbi:hypothetical protein ABIE27_001090 [Paenibacillus sp. 4624]|uniref:Uncharacterized protein n=1 Tax=Paenibacillus amylolyticus TaxID=1451 RepID=A0A5M9WRJ2_PAEAM|nr:hypothetical protein [Paenibacillus amylolyticus]KAA8784109.1 hypothetical protein EC604_09640 [Paenibacillus amylolyticus]
MKRNTIHAITCALFAALILSSCQSSDRPNPAELNKTPRELGSFYPDNITEVDSIEIMSGSDGSTKRTTNLQLIHDWIEKIRHVNIVQHPDAEDTTGVLFHVTMFKQENVIFYMTPTHMNHQPIEPQGELADLMTELYEAIP